ncbi:hypothetical protein DNU06_15275 [Putridiphycobacter roseus]|uniref:Uncharacterized protein n=1 Tax=Putridiphycobacter roseus TaxID=2219161 RepID=A0A2W1MVZ7_9FLAO|nr:hypothetical protein [Putridiphycobacter roseus]PZE16007.1 hypothetical protein DNU06_15275 [Putridiphycobacter roseus]
MSQKVKFIIFSFIIGGVVSEGLFIMTKGKIEINSLLVIIPTYFILKARMNWIERKRPNKKVNVDNEIIDGDID